MSPNQAYTYHYYGFNINSINAKVYNDSSLTKRIDQFLFRRYAGNVLTECATFYPRNAAFLSSPAALRSKLK